MTLETLPTEMIREIFGHLEDGDIRSLRLFSRSIGAIADSLALKQINFCMFKPDFSNLLAIAQHPIYHNHVISLMYVVEMLTLERQTLEMYTRAIRADEKLNERMKEAGSQHRRFWEPVWTDAEVLADFRRYDDLWQAQNDILTNNLDYKVLEEAITMLPNLKEIAISRGNNLRILPYDQHPHSSCRRVHDGEYNDGRASTRHFRAVLKAVQAAGTRLHAIRAIEVHNEILDETKFGLHNMTDLLGDVTYFELAIEANEERPSRDTGPQRLADVEREIEECRAMVQTHVLRRILDCMPLLATLKLFFVECHDFFHDPFPSPAILSDVIPAVRTWNNLKVVEISNVETDRQELVRFFARHKESLMSILLDRVTLATSSWQQLLPSLRSVLFGTNIVPSITGSIVGRSEDGLETLENWWLGGGDYDEPGQPTPLGLTVTEYLTCPEDNPGMNCPLTEDNMGASSGGDEGSVVSNQGSEWEDDSDWS